MATSKSGTLTPDVVAPVTVTGALQGVWVVNRSETGEDIWVRTDGVDPTVGGDNCTPVAGAAHFPDADANRDGSAELRLIASGAYAYTVQAGPADLLPDVGGGGGGVAGGSATAANQVTGNNTLTAISNKLATAKTADLDTGGGTDTVQLMGLALPKSGGAVVGGTSTDPVRVDPTGATDVTALTGSDQTVAGAPGAYRGFTIRETTGSAEAVVTIYDNTSAAGTILEAIKLAAGESRSDFYPGGLKALIGIYVDIVSGTVVGSVRHGS